MSPFERLQNEQLDGQIGVDVNRAHIGDHLAPGRILDDLAELGFHHLLKAASHLVDGFDLAGLDQRALHSGETALQDRHDRVVDLMSLGLGRPLPVIAGVELNQASRDLREDLSPYRIGRCVMRGNGKPPDESVAAPLG